ncbi:motility associated factor glycosyltransferase family protein [Helicobacter sp. 23-1044]
MQNRMLKNIAFFSNNKIAKSLQNAVSGQNRKYQLYFTQDEINIVDLQNRRFLYPKGAFVSVAQNIAQTPLNNDKWRIYANNLGLKKLQKNSDGNYGVTNLKATAEAINKMVDIAHNSFSGNHSADLVNRLKAHRTQSPLSLCRFAKNYESTTAIPSVVDSTNLKSKINPSLRENERSEFSWQSTKKTNPCDSTESRPLRGAKNREQGCSSATRRFFARSGESEALPLKAKSGSFWRVGGAGRGVQPFLREKTNESNKQNNETIAESQNLNRDSSLRASTSRENDNFVDGCFASLAKQGEAEVSLSNSANCHDSASQNLAMTAKIADSANEMKNTESSAISQNLNVAFHLQNTHPLAPSAREGEQKAESAPASSLRDSRSESKQSKTTSDSAEVSCDGFVGCAEKFERDRTNGSSSENFSNSREYAQETIAQNAYHLPPLFLPQTNIFGLCGGLFLDILLEMGYFFHSLLIYEEEAELFALSCYFVDYELLFSRTSPKSCYIFIENLLNKGLLNHYFYSKKITNNFLRLELSLLKSHKIEAFKQLTFETYRANARGWGSFEDEMVGLKNAFINAKNAPFLRLNHKLKTPICVVGSGPSLESNINFIRANQNKMLIFSCGTALKVLKAHKIRIDFQIEIERVPYLAEVLQSSNLGDTATLCASLVNPKVLELSHHTLLFMRGGSAASYIFDEIAPQIATQIAPLEFCAPFVGNAGFSLACAMSDEIIMCGMDCGFVRGFAKHASGSIYGDERAEIPADCFKVEGNCKDFEVFSNAIFSLSKESFALAIAHYKPKFVHNLSFGAKIKGAVFAPNLTLKSIAKREKLPHFLISESQVDLAKADLKKSAILFINELINALNCEISTKEQLFTFIDKMSEFLAYTSQNNPKVGILFEGSMCHLLQSAMIAMLSIKSNDIKTPFCACRTAILGAIADFETQIKGL